MALKLRSHHGNHLIVIAKTERCTVQGNESTTTIHEIQQCFCLIVTDAVDIGVQHQTIQLGEILRGQNRSDVLGVLDVHTSLGECWQ